MSQTILKIKGLATAPNELSSVPEGSLLSAKNVVLSDDNVLESRRGESRLSAVFQNTSDRAHRFAFFQGKQIAAIAGERLAYSHGGSWTEYSGTYNDPDSATARLRFLEAASNLYFTTSAGIKKLDAYTATPTSAGAPRGLDIQLTLTGASGYLEDQNQVAYRVVWGIRDANNLISTGSPSGRAEITNNVGGTSTRDVTVSVSIPPGITTGHFFQVYRSPFSGDVAVSASDEMQLIYEANPTSAEITAKLVSFTDRQPNSLRGQTLYTSPSLEGISQANERPPLAKDLVEFKLCAIYANTISKHRLFLTILAAGGSGIVNNDTVTIAGTTYTAKGTEAINSLEFKAFIGGTPAQNIADTSNSLVRVINRNTTNTLVHAQYISGSNDTPGKLLIEEASLGGVAFAAISSRGSAFNPVLPASGTAISSANDSFQNQIMFSKPGLPESVPLANNRLVGSASTPILRVLPLRNSCFIFKTDGIWRMTGDGPHNFAVEPFDSSAKLIAPDSAVVLNNQIWMLSDQGVAFVTETGISVISRPIENLILDVFATGLDVVKRYSFGVAYESGRKYFLFTPSTAADLYPTKVFIFNTFTNGFTSWPWSKTCGLVHPTEDKLHLGDGLTSFTTEERKALNFTDYVDQGVEYTINSSSALDVYLSSTNDIKVGDVLYQTSTRSSRISAVDTAFVTVAGTVAWELGSVTVFRGIDCEATWVPITGGNPGVEKQIAELIMFFKTSRFDTAYVDFATDVSGSFETVEINGSRLGLWGQFPWGGLPWGGANKAAPIRIGLPLEKQRCSQLTVRFRHRQGFGQFKLLGLSIPSNSYSGKAGK